MEHGSGQARPRAVPRLEAPQAEGGFVHRRAIDPAIVIGVRIGEEDRKRRPEGLLAAAQHQLHQRRRDLPRQWARHLRHRWHVDDHLVIRGQRPSGQHGNDTRRRDDQVLLPRQQVLHLDLPRFDNVRQRYGGAIIDAHAHRS